MEFSSILNFEGRDSGFLNLVGRVAGSIVGISFDLELSCSVEFLVGPSNCCIPASSSIFLAARVFVNWQRGGEKTGSDSSSLGAMKLSKSSSLDLDCRKPSFL